MSELHFLRPVWLLLLVFVVAIPWFLRHRSQARNGWSRVIPAPLLRPLTTTPASAGGNGRAGVLLTAMLATITLALAGPAWRQAPSPLQEYNDSLVIVLDLSLSMLAADVEPDRLTRARRKIHDILDTREGAFTGLVVYAADAHTVTPLTDDSRTVSGLLPVLDPLIMPAAGNRADLGVARARDLLDQGAPGKGRILLISDGVDEPFAGRLREQLGGTPWALSALVVGTAEGGPIALPDHGFIRDDGDIVITSTDLDSMRRLARDTGGQAHALTLDNDDIRALELRAEDSDDWQQSREEFSIQRWQDDGYWLLWLLLPLVLAGWRRGALVMVTLVLLQTSPRPAMALDWTALWQREDQRAPELIADDPKAAAEALQDPGWRGTALYRAEEYEAAARAFAREDNARGAYNRGNALARAGELEAALAAYDQALARDPALEDARHNRELVRQALEQQQQQEQQEQQQGDNGEPENNDRDGNPPSSSGAAPGTGPDQEPQQNPGEDSSAGEPEPPQQPQAPEAVRTPEAGEPGDTDTDIAPIESRPLSSAQEQRLRRIPDNPGGLLQRKFLQQYQNRNTPQDESDTPW